MNRLRQILAISFVFGLAAAGKTQCPLAACSEACLYGNKINPKTKCPIRDCKTKSEATKCQKEFAEGMKNPILGKLVLQCDKFGEYKAKQFHESNYGCFDRAGKLMGNWVAAPEGEDLLCKCRREAADGDAEMMPGKFVPQCEDAGHYKSKQCHRSSGYCWCADPETGEQVGDKKRRGEELNCE